MPMDRYWFCKWLHVVGRRQSPPNTSRTARSRGRDSQEVRISAPVRPRGSGAVLVDRAGGWTILRTSGGLGLTSRCSEGLCTYI